MSAVMLVRLQFKIFLSKKIRVLEARFEAAISQCDICLTCFQFSVATNDNPFRVRFVSATMLWCSDNDIGNLSFES